jgi:hypothetical protein
MWAILNNRAIYMNSGGKVTNNIIRVATEGHGIYAQGTATSYAFTISDNDVVAEGDCLYLVDFQDSVIANNRFETQGSGNHPITSNLSALSYDIDSSVISGNYFYNSHTSGSTADLVGLRDVQITGNVFVTSGDKAMISGESVSIVGNTFTDPPGDTTRTVQILDAISSGGPIVVKDNYFESRGNLVYMVLAQGPEIEVSGNTFYMPSDSAARADYALNIDNHASPIYRIIHGNNFSSEYCGETAIYMQTGAHGDVSIQHNIGKNYRYFLRGDGSWTGDELIIANNIYEPANLQTFFLSNGPTFTNEYIYNNQGYVVGNPGITPKWLIHPGSIKMALYEDSLADNAEFSFPTTSSGGWGFASTADNGIYGGFWFTSAGAVTLMAEVSANFVGADPGDGATADIAVYDGGTVVKLINRTNATQQVQVVIYYR